MNIQKNTFTQAKDKFIKKIMQSSIALHMPSKKHSMERNGGWILRDQYNMYVGWVGNLGDIAYVDYRETTADNVDKINPAGLGFDGVK